MGRRAKNKQAAPIPLHVPGPSPKKLGKRKADEEDAQENRRPVKKAKETGFNDKGRTKVKISAKAKDAVKGRHSDKAKIRPRKTADLDKDDASEGWEDVEDDVDLKAQARCTNLGIL